METISPALADAFALLRQDIHGYLENAEELADRLSESPPAPLESLCDLVSDLTVIVRGVMMDHRATATGTCPTCNTAWPCSAVRTIHRLVKDPGGEFVRLAQRRADRR